GPSPRPDAGRHEGYWRCGGRGNPTPRRRFLCGQDNRSTRWRACSGPWASRRHLIRSGDWLTSSRRVRAHARGRGKWNPNYQERINDGDWRAAARALELIFPEYRRNAKEKNFRTNSDT